MIPQEDINTAIYNMLYGKSSDAKSLLVPDAVKSKLIDALSYDHKPTDDEIKKAIEWASETLINFQLLKHIQLGAYHIGFHKDCSEPWFSRAGNKRDI